MQNVLISLASTIFTSAPSREGDPMLMRIWIKFMMADPSPENDLQHRVAKLTAELGTDQVCSFACQAYRAILLC